MSVAGLAGLWACATRGTPSSRQRCACAVESADIDCAHLIKNYAGTGTTGPDWLPALCLSGLSHSNTCRGTPQDRPSFHQPYRARADAASPLHPSATGFSKTLDNVKAMVEVCVVWYNCCRAHHTLRIALEAGWADHIWTVREPWLT